MSKLSLLAALLALDTTNDNHWTSEGAPRLDTLKFMTGQQALTREQVSAAAPGVSRANPYTASTGLEGVVSEAGTGTAASDAPARVQAASQGAGDGESDGTGAGSNADSEGDAGEQGDAEQGGLARAQDALRLALEGKAAADRAVASATAAVDREIEALEEAGQGQNAHSAVSGYHESQRRLMQERAEKMRALKGIDLKAILPHRAPLDVALGRRNARGTARPKTLV